MKLAKLLSYIPLLLWRLLYVLTVFTVYYIGDCILFIISPIAYAQSQKKRAMEYSKLLPLDDHLRYKAKSVDYLKCVAKKHYDETRGKKDNA